MFSDLMILVRGAGDLGSGVIYRLHQAGFPVVAAELPQPLFVRRAVAYGAAVYNQTVVVDGITARLAATAEVNDVLARGEVPVVTVPGEDVIAALRPAVVVDARMAKASLDCDISHASLVIALGPGYEPGVHCHAVIETNRGHSLGRVLLNKQAQPDTGEPGSVGGVSSLRVLRAPAAGYLEVHKEIGDMVRCGELVAEVAGKAIEARIDGVVRGLIHPSVEVWPGLKIGDVDPRAERENCFTISEKSLAVGGGVVEAVLSADVIRQRLKDSCALET
ncbi:MAG: EF2563 family selenium-dependent molybdenum hydroxylase system protein [Anaerolineae bacterium]|nr:EF2563 family selenium-dependent molybdenum hydroxylase system protein [Anaerolineae bacterium]